MMIEEIVNKLEKIMLFLRGVSHDGGGRKKFGESIKKSGIDSVSSENSTIQQVLLCKTGGSVP